MEASALVMEQVTDREAVQEPVSVMVPVLKETAADEAENK